jgi:hypothetical protein
MIVMLRKEIEAAARIGAELYYCPGKRGSYRPGYRAVVVAVAPGQPVTGMRGETIGKVGRDTVAVRVFVDVPADKQGWRPDSSFKETAKDARDWQMICLVPSRHLHGPWAELHAQDVAMAERRDAVEAARKARRDDQLGRLAAVAKAWPELVSAHGALQLYMDESGRVAVPLAFLEALSEGARSFVGQPSGGA